MYLEQSVDHEVFTESCKISKVGFDFRLLNSGNFKFQLFDQEISEVSFNIFLVFALQRYDFNTS